MHSPCLNIVAEAKGMEGRKRERVEDGGWVGAERERERGRAGEKDKERRGSALGSSFISLLIRGSNNIPPARTTRRWVCFF